MNFTLFFKSTAQRSQDVPNYSFLREQISVELFSQENRAILILITLGLKKNRMELTLTDINCRAELQVKPKVNTILASSLFVHRLLKRNEFL